MSKKILYCASTLSHLKNFHSPYLKAFQEQQLEVWIASDSCEKIPYIDHSVQIPFCKSFLSLQNIKAIWIARKLLLKEEFDILSTHTTLASAIMRAAVLLLPKKKRPKVFNTCHGYLFHETDGIKKWIYLLPEKICASVTDVLMVMNQEDYKIAQKHRLYQYKLDYINGMGIDLAEFAPISADERKEKRAEMGFTEQDFLFIYAAELSKRKNHADLINAFAETALEIPQAHLLLAGSGALLEDCKALAKTLGAEHRIHFLGFISPMKALYPLCDAAVSTSLIEGLPFNIMEAMASGLPVIASDIKGHRELAECAGVTLVHNHQELVSQLIALVRAPSAQACDITSYGLDVVFPKIISIYELDGR